MAPDQVEDFVRRQRAARLRVALMDAFYLRYPCRMGALHRLAGLGIAVARFAGHSEAYHRIGEALCPVDDQGLPRSEAWRDFVRTFEEGRPADVREEAWLVAHLQDMEEVRTRGLVQEFEAERADHLDDPTWAMLQEHMQVTLGTRLRDREALTGEIALETAIASSLTRVVRRQLTTGLGLVRTFVGAAAGATLRGGPWVPPHLPSDRSLVWRLVRVTARLARVGRVWRRGTALADRGALRPGAAWSLGPSLDEVLGTASQGLHPTVRELFEAMHRFEMTASVHLHHRLGRWLAWMATLLVGQGMYEEDLDQVPARFQLFRRGDGSMHFVREFWCDEAIRRFDSDFVVRSVDAAPTLLEVFTELGVAACMKTEVLEDGGLAMTVRRLFVRGVPVGVGPCFVRFETRPDAEGTLLVTGVLDLRAGALTGFWLHRVLGLPERVGEIRYQARSLPAEP